MTRAVQPSAETPTLHQLLLAVRADPDLPKNSRGTMINAVRSFVKYADLNPMTTKASLIHCREALFRVEPAAIGITRAHWMNVKSALRLAITRYAGGYKPDRRPLDPEWRRLRVKLTSIEADRRLSRFVRWCNNASISPGQVDDDVSQRYFAHLTSETTVQNPKALHRYACHMWNTMADTTMGWPKRRLAIPCYRIRVALPIEAFPASFRADLDAWRRCLISTDLVVSEGPPRPFRPDTVKGMVQRTLRFASVLVREGIPITEITGLAAIVRLDRFRLGVEHFWRRYGSKTTRTQYEMARTIKYIAKHWVRVAPMDMFILTEMTRRLHSEPIQLAAKNRDVLRQFNDPVNVKKLLALPRRLEVQAGHASERSASRKAALLMQQAVGIELLLVAPIRQQNLSRLEVGVHFRSYFRDGQRGVYLVILPDLVKNRVPLEFELPQETIDLLGRYLVSYRPCLTKGPTSMLFPGEVEGHKGPWFARQIKATIRRYTGLQVHGHAFRHIAAKLHLMKRPNDYLPVSLMLGHKSVETTKKFYCFLEMQPAARQYAEEVLGKRFSLG